MMHEMTQFLCNAQREYNNYFILLCAKSFKHTHPANTALP